MSSKKNNLTDIDPILEWYHSKMPKKRFLLKDKPRYEAIYNSIKIISDFIQKVSPDAVIEVRHDEMNPSAIYLKVTTDEIIIEDIKGFCAALSESSNVEFYPRGKGNITMSILYNDSFSPAPPYNEINKDDKA